MASRERETKRMRNLSHEQLQPSGIASKTSLPGSLCLEQSPVLRDLLGWLGTARPPRCVLRVAGAAVRLSKERQEARRVLVVRALGAHSLPAGRDTWKEDRGEVWTQFWTL